MTEVTRVPLQPIAKGSLTKLWIGVLLAIIIGAGIAWAAVPKGVQVTTITAGSGANPGPEDVVFVNYVGKLANGEVFDESQQVPLPVKDIFPEGNPLPLDRMIPGFTEGALQMQKGGKYVISIPAAKGYGAAGEVNPQTGEAVIPPNSDLTFEVELVDFMSQDDFERRISVFQQMMEQQQGGEGGAGAPMPPPNPEQ